MGSWFETCFVSQLPIREGEPCRLFFLERVQGWGDESSGAGFCYPHGMWAPCSFALKGRYGDYGRVEGINLDSFEARYALESLKDRLVELPAEAEGRRNGAVIKADLTLESAQEQLSEGRLNFQDHQGRVQPYGMVFLRDDVYRALVRKGWSCSWRTPKRFTAARFVQQGEAIVTALRALIAERDQHEEYHKRFVSGFDIEYLKSPELESEYDIQRFLRDSSVFRTLLSQELIDLVRTDSPDLPRFLRLVAEQYMFRGHLYSLRRAWMPQCGKGSQVESYDEHIWLAKLAQKICARELSRVD